MSRTRARQTFGPYMRGQQMLASMLEQVKLFKDGKLTSVHRRDSDVALTIASDRFLPRHSTRPRSTSTPGAGRFRCSRRCIPMNNCSQAPQTDVTRAAAERYLESWNAIGMDWDAWMAEVQLAKAEFARLINASPDEIAVFSSVSEATSAVASAIDFSGGRSTVVVTEAEFPTIGHVWLAQEPRGARVRGCRCATARSTRRATTRWSTSARRSSRRVTATT